ncbi:hypothetical protein PR003_g12277 [Phytophthora rubi]|uniref:Uncharacterized protein n=1 Tax=Phytophthora rubi TaxID=129364 RepID=A0A6A3NHL7_9STRA|nr:hypothetical protein PR002_g5262 [Phytophthora rubi]KAE9336903.1 hypothetical protein PR003_g12277 [Phytophthora rubi]
MTGPSSIIGAADDGRSSVCATLSPIPAPVHQARRAAMWGEAVARVPIPGARSSTSRLGQISLDSRLELPSKLYAKLSPIVLGP